MRACGQVAQVHGIPPFSARVVQRTVRLISGVALDECLDPEHYRARVPFFEPLNAKKLERPGSFISYAHLESAGRELVEETSQGFIRIENEEYKVQSSAFCTLHLSLRLRGARATSRSRVQKWYARPVTLRIQALI